MPQAGLGGCLDCCSCIPLTEGCSLAARRITLLGDGGDDLVVQLLPHLLEFGVSRLLYAGHLLAVDVDSRQPQVVGQLAGILHDLKGGHPGRQLELVFEQFVVLLDLLLHSLLERLLEELEGLSQELAAG